MANKKGQEMSVSTLVLIVIGIVVLVMLILGFSMGWQNLWGKINILGGSNLETIVQSCNIAATSDSVASYCEEFKLLSKGEYVTCNYPKVKESLTKPLICTDDVTVNATIKEKCLVTAKLSAYTGVSGENTTIKGIKDKYNGQTCASLFGI